MSHAWSAQCVLSSHEIFSDSFLGERVSVLSAQCVWSCECSDWSQVIAQRACVFAAPATGETEVSGCKRQQLKWYHGSRVPYVCGLSNWSEGGLGASSRRGTMDHRLVDLRTWMPVNGETQLIEMKCQPMGWDQELEGHRSVVPATGMSVGVWVCEHYSEGQAVLTSAYVMWHGSWVKRLLCRWDHRGIGYWGTKGGLATCQRDCRAWGQLRNLLVFLCVSETVCTSKWRGAVALGIHMSRCQQLGRWIQEQLLGRLNVLSQLLEGKIIHISICIITSGPLLARRQSKAGWGQWCSVCLCECSVCLFMVCLASYVYMCICDIHVCSQCICLLGIHLQPCCWLNLEW